MQKTCPREKGKLPQHKHFGVYDKPKFGFHDEGEAIKDYRTLRRHLKSKKAKKLLDHVIGEEVEHKPIFKKIIKLECEAKKK